MGKKVMIAMSGGVDSSVAAVLLKEQNYEVCGATLKLFSNDNIGLGDSNRSCCSLKDIEDARKVAYLFGFDHYVFNFGRHFQHDVIERFANSYLNGETPNPCIDCNRYIKFNKLLERALLLGFDLIATGHYAQIDYNEKTNRYLLKKAKDLSKDQTYALYAMSQDELAKTLFPLGGLLKSEVRQLAAQFDLVNAEKPDSQDICFVKDGDYTDFLERVMGITSAPGYFIDKNGKVLGMHKGIYHYTIGQRRRLDINLNKPQYVISIDKEKNSVVLGDEKDLYSESLIAGDINMIAIEKLKEPMSATVKTRYKQKETRAKIYPYKQNQIKVIFEKKQRAITPGQAIVFYDGDIVLGGGTILS